jgi:hypothetical protein
MGNDTIKDYTPMNSVSQNNDCDFVIQYLDEVYYISMTHFKRRLLNGKEESR